MDILKLTLVDHESIREIGKMLLKSIQWVSIMFSFLGRMGSLKYWIASTKTAEESI